MGVAAERKEKVTDKRKKNHTGEKGAHRHRQEVRHQRQGGRCCQVCVSRFRYFTGMFTSEQQNIKRIFRMQMTRKCLNITIIVLLFLLDDSVSTSVSHK